jgi:hypothetical protein
MLGEVSSPDLTKFFEVRTYPRMYAQLANDVAFHSEP